MTATTADVRAEPAGATWTDGPLHWVALVAALVTSVALAWPGFDVLYRFDEVQSVVIADRPLWDVPAALRLDGAPPLYYLILDVWMKVFGTSPAATYSLSTIFGLGTIVAVWWLGTRLAGRAAGVLAAWLVAANPFFVPFMAETRNYTLFALLGVLAVGFGDAAVHDGRRRDVVRFGITLAALLYTHAWGLFLVGAIILCLGAWSWSDRAAVKRIVVGAAIAGVAFLPWLPIAYDQARHTAAPWQDDTSLKGAIFVIDTFFESRRLALVAVLAIVVAAVLAWRKSERFTYVVLAIGPITLGAAWVVSTLVSPMFVPRYGLPALVIAFAAWAGLAVANRVAVALAAVVVVLGLAATASNAADLERYSKSPVVDLADVVADTDVDLVIANEEDLVSIARVTDGVALVGPTGPLVEEGLFDWRDDLDDLRDTDVAATVNTALSALEPGQRVALVWDPNPRPDTTEWQSLFFTTMVDAVEAVEAYGLTQVEQQTFTTWEITVFEK